MRNVVCYTAVITMALSIAAGVCAQEVTQFPTKPVKFVVPLAASGGVDALARLLAEELRVRWGQSVLVENRAGAGGNVGAEAVYRADPDGHTLLFTLGSVLTLNKAIYGKLNFEPDDFVPVSVLVTNYSVLLVHPRVAAENVQQLIALAKADRSTLNYASPGVGTGSHLSAELFNSMAGVEMVHIPYKGSAPAFADVLAGRVPIFFGELGGSLPHIRSGRLRALAVTSERRHPSLPSVPTVAETLPGFLSTPWTGLAAPPRTPLAVARRISATVADVLKQPDFAKRLAERSLEPVGSTPEEMSRFIKEEIERWGKVVRSVGIKPG